MGNEQRNASHSGKTCEEGKIGRVLERVSVASRTLIKHRQVPFHCHNLLLVIAAWAIDQRGGASLLVAYGR
jgi:hypothetical protein